MLERVAIPADAVKQVPALLDRDPRRKGADPVEVWVPVRDDEGQVRIFESVSKRDAIEQCAGKGADARPGVYKAPNLSSWRGGEEFTLPERPVPTRKALSD